MLKQLVGLAGRIGSGKTTAANYLVNNHDFTNVKFAGPLKDMCRALGLSEDEINGPLKEKPCDLLDGQTPRWAQQSLGTEWGRVCISPNLWTNVWKRRLCSDLIVSDDVRFPNEAALIRELGGVVLMIKRPAQVAVAIDSTAVEVHPSEQFNLDPDLIIHNDGTIVELERAIARALALPYA